MGFSSFRARIEKAFFGTTFDDVFDRIGDLNRAVDRLSARMDERMARIRKDLQQQGIESVDSRDGVYIVEDDCIGCQICVDVAPETFRMRDDGIAEVYNPRGTGFPKVREAADSCGSACIKFV